MKYYYSHKIGRGTIHSEEVQRKKKESEKYVEQNTITECYCFPSKNALNFLSNFT